MYETQLSTLQNQQFNVDQMAFNSESIQSNIDMFAAMKDATAAQQEQMKQINYNDLEDLYENMAEMMEDQEEINEMMQRDFGVGEFNEDDLMDELNDLDEELAMAEMQGQTTGSNLAKPEENKNEEDMLNDIMN